MSETTISTDFFEDAGVSIQYGCSMCGNIFDSEKHGEEHIRTCRNSTLNSDDPLAGASNNDTDRAPKRKLDKCINVCKNDTDSISLNKDPSFNDRSDNGSLCKKTKLSDISQEQKDNMLEGTTYEATSQMLSCNEMLITLPYDGGNDYTDATLNFSDNVTIELEQFEDGVTDFQIRYNPHTFYENSNESNESNHVIINYDETPLINIENESKIKIESVLATEPQQKDAGLINIHEKDPHNSNNVQILTVLNNVDVNQIVGPHEDEELQIIYLDKNNGEQETNFEFESEVQNESGGQAGNWSSSGVKDTRHERQMNGKASTPKSHKNKPKLQSNNTENENVASETPQIPSPKDGLNEPEIISTKKADSKLLSTLYKKIPKPVREKTKEPCEYSVYEFFDEEEEKLKERLREEEEKEKELKARTCRFCKEVFKDPIDVLRHKRQFHKSRKLNLSKEELEPYLKLRNQTECPLCLRQLSQFKSIYVKHLMTHCDEYDFNCRICGLQFRRKDHWLNHERRHIVPPESDQIDQKDALV